MTVKARDARKAVPDQVLDELRPEARPSIRIVYDFAPRPSVSKVAQHYGVNANLLFTRRRQREELAKSLTLSTISAVSGPLAQSKICW